MNKLVLLAVCAVVFSVMFGSCDAFCGGCGCNIWGCNCDWEPHECRKVGRQSTVDPETFDVDKNGLIDRNEFVRAFPAEYLKTEFNELDRDADGFISRSETGIDF